MYIFKQMKYISIIIIISIIIMTHRQLRSVATTLHDVHIRSSALCHISLQLASVPLPICCIRVF